MADKLPLVQLSTSDMVGMIERGLKEMLMYLGNNNPQQINTDDCKQHFAHLIGHFDRLKAMQLERAAMAKAEEAANSNSREGGKAFLRN